MVQQSVIEYIQKLLKQGYDVETIRSTLLGAGYSPQDVDTALRVASGKHIPVKPLLIIFAVIFVLALLVYGILAIIQTEPVVLSFSVSALSSTVAPGQELILTADIRNPSGTSTSGLLDYALTGPGRIAAPSQPFTVAERERLPSTIMIPADAQIGSYTLTATISYKDKRSTQRLTIDIAAEAPPETEDVLTTAPEEKARELQLTCPGGCDDLNFCTTDTCVQGTCVHDAIVPCCGNRDCESGETESSCPLDCGAQPVTPEDTTARARQQAQNDVSGAIDTCNSMGQRSFIDSCLNAISEISNSQEPCEHVVDDDTRDSCYIPFAYDGDYDVCTKILNPYLKNACISLSELNKYDEIAKSSQ